MLRDAYIFILPLLTLSVLSALLGWQFWAGFYWLSLSLLGLALFVAYFFRDPERQPPTDDRLVVSPADGWVVVVKPVDAANPAAGTLVSIFLTVFDVHVNRSPIAGVITSVEYRRGKFLVASEQKASVENEQNIVTVENQYVTVVFKQIAGLIARRIVFWRKTRDHLALGERVGLIKFGSRTDVILPPQVMVLVKKGERVKGGVSVIGRVDV